MNRELSAFKSQYLSSFLQKDVDYFKEIFFNDAMFRTRYININSAQNLKCCLLFMDGMVNSEIINEAIIKPLAVINIKKQKDLCEFIEKSIVCANEIKYTLQDSANAF